jgi:hypothetical protein
MSTDHCLAILARIPRTFVIPYTLPSYTSSDTCASFGFIPMSGSPHCITFCFFTYLGNGALNSALQTLLVEAFKS